MRDPIQTGIAQKGFRLAEVANQDIIHLQGGQFVLGNVELAHVLQHALQPALRIAGARKQKEFCGLIAGQDFFKNCTAQKSGHACNQ